MTNNIVPLRCGIGLRYPHYNQVVTTLPDLGWVEVHSENFFGGGAALAMLEQIATHYPVSLHGVSLGLGTVSVPDPVHLSALRAVVERIRPALISEHLCFNRANGRYVNDLLPIPYTHDMLATVADHVDRVQQFLGQRLLLENLTSYLCYPENNYTEGEFLAALVARTGCAILLDINNLYINERNLGLNSIDILSALPAEAIAEYHIGGFMVQDKQLIDSHSQAPDEDVWRLFEHVVAHFGARPTLIEWDRAIPELAVLRTEAQRAETILLNTRLTTLSQAFPPGTGYASAPNDRTSASYALPIQQSKTCASDASARWQNALVNTIIDPTDKPASNGVARYRTQYQLTLLDTLASIFPATRCCVGYPAFATLARDYIAFTPSYSGNLHAYGESFAEFVRTSATLKSTPFLGDFAQLEWAIHNAYYAVDERPLEPQALATFEADAWSHLTLALAKHSQMISSAWPIVSLWHSHQTKHAEPLNTLSGLNGEIALVYRRSNRVNVQAIATDYSTFFAALVQQHSLEKATEAALTLNSQFDLTAVLADLFRCQILTRVVPSA